MAVTTPTFPDEAARALPYERFPGSNRQPAASAVSWGAILAGAAAAAALSLILLILGTGLGLSSVSPWYQRGMDAATFGLSTILWLTVTQLLASAMGGYLAGRLRTKWIEVETDEIYFRDTAHGFLAWAVAALVTAGLLGSAIGSILNGGAHAGSAMMGHGLHGSAHAGRGDFSSTSYFIDSLFRREPAADATSANTDMPHHNAMRRDGRELREVKRIFQQVAVGETLPPADLRYVGQLVSQRTGLSQSDAEARVSETYARLQTTRQATETTALQAADAARKASSHAALWLFVSLLAGAFIASLSATVGGRSRDA